MKTSLCHDLFRVFALDPLFPTNEVRIPNGVVGAEHRRRYSDPWGLPPKTLSLRRRLQIISCDMKQSPHALLAAGSLMLFRRLGAPSDVIENITFKQQSAGFVSVAADELCSCRIVAHVFLTDEQAIGFFDGVMEFAGEHISCARENVPVAEGSLHVVIVLDREAGSAGVEVADHRPKTPPVTEATVAIPLRTAQFVDNVFLPANPNKLRRAHPDVVQAAKVFKSLVAMATRGISSSIGQAHSAA